MTMKTQETAIEKRIDCCHTIRVLKKAGITTMEKLSGFSKEELLQLRGIGPVIAGDLEQKIAEWLKEE